MRSRLNCDPTAGCVPWVLAGRFVRLRTASVARGLLQVGRVIAAGAEHMERSTQIAKRWPLFVIALASIGLITMRMRWPTLVFDSTSLILFAIAAAVLAASYLPLKRIRVGELEMELERLQDDISTGYFLVRMPMATRLQPAA